MLLLFSLYANIIYARHRDYDDRRSCRACMAQHARKRCMLVLIRRHRRFSWRTIIDIQQAEMNTAFSALRFLAWAVMRDTESIELAMEREGELYA